MEAKRTYVGRLALTLGVALATAFGILLVPTASFAAQISGATHYFAVAGGGWVSQSTVEDKADVLDVSGAQGETVFIKVTKGDGVIADRMARPLDDLSGQTGEDTFAGIVTMNFKGGLDTKATYGVTVYSDLQETQQLFEGTIYPVFASVDGLESPIAIGTQTVATGDDPAAAFVAPQTIPVGGVTYSLTDPKPADGTLTYSYTRSNDASNSIGTIEYVDEDGNHIASDTVEGIDQKAKAAEVRRYVTSEDGKDTYRALNWSPTVTLSYAREDGQVVVLRNTVIVSCKKIDPVYAKAEGLHRTTINYVDENGKKILSDNVTVTSTVHYSVPNSVYAEVYGDDYVQDEGETGAVVKAFTLATEGQDPRLTGNVLTLKPEDTSQNTDTVNVKFTGNTTDPITWTVQCVYMDPTTGKRVVLDQDTQTVERKQDAQASYKSVDITYDGTTYVPAAGSQTYTYTYGSDSMPQTVIYYVPAGEKPKTDSYLVTIHYKDYATKQEITSKQVTIDHDHGNYAIQSDEQFSFGGVTYVRLAGQEHPIRHNYYSGSAEYTIWYRDINNIADRDARVTRISVEYAEGTTASAPGAAGGATGTEAGGAGATAGDAAGTGAADGATTTGVPTADGGLAAVGTDGGTLVAGDGTDLDTERIEDNETPLASGAGAGKAGQGGGVTAGIAAGIAVSVAAACLIVFFLVRRKKNQTENGNAGSDSEGR